MLQLKKVELLGFKSFCEKTELQFSNGGIAAIVGPNGCGKSNLSDAISWVLGEQSARLLRGTRMEDVIFNGTRDRKPLGMAAVTVTMIDPEVFFRTEAPANGGGENGANGADRPGEMTVTRRLFRSGESEYLMNGRVCRLRDIQELFMGTGLGPECYAIIEQGRIGQILSSRPYDRRAVIEEAAGITKFKTKKKLAEARLESATQNLSRVNDILEEVTRQVQSLKRQASRARRYEELRAEMTSKQAVVFLGRHRNLERLACQAALDLNLATDELRGQTSRVEQLEAEQAAAQKEGFELETQLLARREESSAAAVETERSRQRLDYQARSAEENAARIRQAAAELAAIEGRLADLGRELEAETASAAAVATESAGTRQQIEAKGAELDGVQSALRDREAEQERLRQTVLRLLGEASSLRNQVAQIEAFLEGLERQAARARQEETAAQQDLTQSSAERQALLEKQRQQQLEIESLEQRRARTEAGLGERRVELEERRKTAETLRTEISRLEARQQSLDEILSHRAYTTETVKNLFAAVEQGRFGGFRPRGIVADFIDVEPAHEKAVEAFLREELEYVVVEGWSSAEHGMRLLRAEMEGHATFLVAAETAGWAKAEAPLLPCERLADHVRFSDGLAATARALLPRLGQCYLTEEAEQARLLAGQHPGLYFLLPEGLCYHGHTLSGGRKLSSGPLALKRELRELGPRLADATRDLETQTAAVHDLERAIETESADLETVRGEVQEQEKGAVGSEHQLQQVHDALGRAKTQLSVARLDLERFEEERRRAAAEREQNQAEVDQRDAARSAAEEALGALREAIAGDLARSEQLAEEQARLRAQLAALEERHKAALASAARVEQMLAEQAGRRNETAAQIAEWTAERDRLLADNQRLATEIEDLAGRQQNLEREAKDIEGALHERRERGQRLDESIKILKQEVDQTRERRSGIEIQLVRLQSDLQHVEESCLHEMGKPIGELTTSEEGALDLEAAEVEYLRLKEKIDALGPVNPLALQEYEEAQQRFEFLDTQRQDLFDSIRDTQEAIREIDSVSRQKFLDAFEQINRNFRETFTTLFGGGTGEMRLTDETNIAESGLDIVASPPGKRLQNVLLLSGGEKALTAIALLMAVFQYQPSPFCILDEVDAPLDEPNIVRFSRLIKQMSTQTQFILITHNRTTMESANSLYGVTMQEPGVSKLVSVRLADADGRQARGLTAPPPVLAEMARAAVAK